jgi:DNA-binding NtrC family response regulator
LARGGVTMQTQWNILVASSDLENRTALIHMLERLTVNVYSSSSLRQAEEVLEGRSIALAFCDDHLVDGTFENLLLKIRRSREKTRFIVTTSNGEWDDFLGATRLGAFDMIRWPLQPTDVELIVIRAMHDEERKASCEAFA